MTTTNSIVTIIDDSIADEYDTAVREYLDLVYALNTSYGGRVDFLRGLDRHPSMKDTTGERIATLEAGTAFLDDIVERVTKARELSDKIAYLIREYRADQKSTLRFARQYDEQFGTDTVKFYEDIFASN